MTEQIQATLIAALNLPETDQDRIADQINDMLRDRGLPAPEPLKVIEF